MAKINRSKNYTNWLDPDKVEITIRGEDGKAHLYEGPTHK